MITISVYRTRDMEYKGFCCEGHSGYDDRGKDIVCAAVSALVVNTVNAIEKFTSSDAKVEVRDADGYVKMMFRNKPDDKALLLFDSLILGLSNIENDYKKYVKVSFKEV
ncbi:MAG: ribosomal-processing cysteine protease Prp [Clostridiales bacterium]|nr:ribosomal-processing cysteine protease Prp [Clostridiales bacterium]